MPGASVRPNRRLGDADDPTPAELADYATAQGSIAEGRGPREVVTARLLGARRRGGFLVLTRKGAELPGIAEALAERYEATAVSLNGLFLGALKELAEKQSVRWQALLEADAK
ncbi:hypothetical protein [Streptomyces sp. NPDC018321]|uniref:hypothetical protein n=1 Tax=unclassified Streptomyces TaxID=2593676 RepID=UPI003794E98F